MKQVQNPTQRKAKYFDQLQDFYGEKVADRMIAIPESVHHKMKQTAVKIGKPLYEIYTEAARLYLRAKGVAGQVQGIGDVSAEEQEFLGEIVWLWRNKKTSRVAG